MDEERFIEAAERAIADCNVEVDFDLDNLDSRCITCEKRELCELLIEVKELE